VFQDTFLGVNKEETVLRPTFLGGILIQTNGTSLVTKRMHSGAVNAMRWVGTRGFTVPTLAAVATHIRLQLLY
jgi:hypothetical protein